VKSYSSSADLGVHPWPIRADIRGWKGCDRVGQVQGRDILPALFDNSQSISFLQFVYLINGCRRLRASKHPRPSCAAIAEAAVGNLHMVGAHSRLK